MIELIKQKRMKDKFKREFGATMEDFFEEEQSVVKNAKPNEAAKGKGEVIYIYIFGLDQ